VQVLPVCQRQHQIEIPPPLAGRAANQLEITWREHHRRKLPEGICQSARNQTIERQLLFLRRSLEPDSDLVRGGGANFGGDVKSGGVEAGDVLIPRVTDGAQDLEIVDRLEKIRLAVSVVADEGDTFSGEIQIDPLGDCGNPESQCSRAGCDRGRGGPPISR